MFFSSTNIRTQPAGLNYVTTEIKGADCHACLNSASVFGMERVRNT